MKIPTLLFIVALFLGISANAQKHYKLSDAIQRGLVRLKITGNGGHTGRCATVETENTTTQTLDIDIDCGQKIQNSDSTQQNLMITQAEHVHLMPKSKAARAVYAMCVNASKGNPGKILFRLGLMAQGSLLRLAQFIEQKKWQNSHAQGAVWSITDNKSIASIGDDITEDYEMVNALRGFVAKEKKITNYPKATRKFRIATMVEGTTDVILQKKSNVQVVLMDKNNKVLKQLLQIQKDQGILRINYSVKNTDYDAGVYYIVIKVNNKEEKRERIVLE